MRRTYQPDLCLVLNRSFQSAVGALLCGSRVRAGFASEGRGCLLTHPIPYDSDRREIECYLDILRAVAPEPVGEAPYDPSPCLWITAAERAAGAAILAGREAIGPTLIGFQPGASYMAKQWPMEKFAAVADLLAKGGAGVVLIGGKSEMETARAMRQAMAAPVVDLTGATSLRETMGVLSHLSLFVGNDTGVNHIAAGLGVPTLALFGPTCADKWGNLGPASTVIHAPGGVISRLETEAVVVSAQALLGVRCTVEARR